MNGRNTCIQVKVCGLTRVDEALECLEAGADAIGCVFFPPSPRCVSDVQARDIVRALPPSAWVVGVFVDEEFPAIMAKVEKCGLRAVQLHGRESPQLVERLRLEGLTVIKALFHKGIPPLCDAPVYPASAFLAECAGGPLPGGNALGWEWNAARRSIPDGYPFLLAGGLNPENVASVIQQAAPCGVDVSSGVENMPGRKDLNKVKRFLREVRSYPVWGEIPRVFP